MSVMIPGQGGLPDDYALGFGAEHRLAFGNGEGFEEGCDVAEGDVDTVAAERVDVAGGQRADLFVTDIVGPEACIVHVEHLEGIEAVYLGFGRLDVDTFLGLSVKESGHGDAETSLVSDILAESVLSVGVNSGEHFDLVELSDESLGLFSELGCVLRSPPVGHVAVGVEVAALVVETVGHLVADHHADAAVVLGVGSVRIEEGSLEDGGGEDDLVG